MLNGQPHVEEKPPRKPVVKICRKDLFRVATWITNHASMLKPGPDQITPEKFVVLAQKDLDLPDLTFKALRGVAKDAGIELRVREKKSALARKDRTVIMASQLLIVARNLNLIAEQLGMSLEKRPDITLLRSLASGTSLRSDNGEEK